MSANFFFWQSTLGRVASTSTLRWALRYVGEIPPTVICWFCLYYLNLLLYLFCLLWFISNQNSRCNLAVKIVRVKKIKNPLIPRSINRSQGWRPNGPVFGPPLWHFSGAYQRHPPRVSWLLCLLGLPCCHCMSAMGGVRRCNRPMLAHTIGTCPTAWHMLNSARASDGGRRACAFAGVCTDFDAPVCHLSQSTPDWSYSDTTIPKWAHSISYYLFKLLIYSI